MFPDKRAPVMLSSWATPKLPEKIQQKNLKNIAEINMTTSKTTSSQPIGAVLVVGGGIAGMQAALDMADSGFYVYLVEKSPSIGGVMAQLDKTFPTNDCSM